MDRHDLDENIDAEHVARIHQEDLKYEHEFGCKGLTYWYDGQRKTAFCLINAPNKEALAAMHNKAHGGIPNSIIEVNPLLVESFLGRITDPAQEKNENMLPIIDDPAFRIIMMIKVTHNDLNGLGDSAQNELMFDFHGFVIDQISHFNGRLVRNSTNSNLISFRSVSDALECALIVYSEYKTLNSSNKNHSLHIGISSGLPVTGGKGFFEETIVETERLCNEVSGGVVITYDVFELTNNTYLRDKIKHNFFRLLKPSDQLFLCDLMNFTEKSWNRTNLKIDDFSASLGLSKSQLYRKVKFLTGKSLNIFLKSYRLRKAIKMIEAHKGNISEIAFDSGFNSAAYFSKCFMDTYGVLPSEFAKTNILSQ